MANFTYDMRTTKDIIHDITKNLNFPLEKATYKLEYDLTGSGMRDLIIYENNTFEIKTVQKKIRINSANHSKNKDATKNLLYDTYSSILELIGIKTFFYKGELVISDTLQDYIITIIKKK